MSFEDKFLQTVVGTIVRIDSHTATIDPGDDTQWRVGFARCATSWTFDCLPSSSSRGC